MSAHWACVQPQVGTPGADLLAWCWVLSQGGGACSPGNQPSLPDSASPPQQDPRTLWVCPLVHPQLVPSLPFGTRVGTQLTEANSDFTDSTCSPPPLVLPPGALPSLGVPPSLPSLASTQPRGALAQVLSAQGSRLGEGGTPGLLW